MRRRSPKFVAEVIPFGRREQSLERIIHFKQLKSFDGVYRDMTKHLFGASIGILTFAVGLTIAYQNVASPDFQQVATAAIWTEDAKCWARNFRDAAGNTVTLWSECPGNEDWTARAAFESEVKLYSILYRSDSRAIGSYQVDDLRGYCVIRLDENRQTIICGLSLESILDFEKQYFPSDVVTNQIDLSAPPTSIIAEGDQD